MNILSPRAISTLRNLGITAALSAGWAAGLGAGVAAGLGSNLPAQGGSKPFSGLLPQATFPSDHAPDLTPGSEKLTLGATWNNWFPFSAGKARQMAIYESHDLKIPSGKNITHVGFQIDPAYKSKGHKLLLRVCMGATTKTAKTVLTNFGANYDGAPVDVYGGAAGKIFDLPDLGDSLNPNKDRPFVWVTLDVPYTYDATKNLIVEYQVLANSNSSQAFSYTLDVAQLVSPVVKIGDGCTDSGGRIPVLKSSPSAVAGTWRITLSGAPTSSAATMLTSFGRATVPIPFLRPDCRVLIDLTPPNFIPFIFVGKTSTSGRFTWSFPIPDDVMFNNVHLNSQVVVADVFAASGITMSNGDDMQIGMHPRMTILTRRGDPTTVTTGSIYRNLGVISHFKHN